MNDIFEQLTSVWESFRKAAIMYFVAGFIFGCILVGMV